MSISKLLALILGLVAISFAAKYALTGTTMGNPEGATQPKRQLDNVRGRAKELEVEQGKAAEDAVKQSDEQQR